MPGRPAVASLLRRVASGELLSPDEENLLRDLASRTVDLPDSITDSRGTRMAVGTVSEIEHQFVEITHIDDASRSFEMKDYGVCIGKLINYLPDEDWAVQYPGSMIEDVDDGEVFCGFVDQSRAGVPGQRYYARSYGTKTCGATTLPFVMLEGGAPTTAVLAEDHPGCGTVFDVWLSPIWNPTSHEWDLDTCDSSDADDKFKAIDLRVWGLDPAKYATGLFVPRVSLTYGIILEVIELDCESPGSCQFCED